MAEAGSGKQRKGSKPTAPQTPPAPKEFLKFSSDIYPALKDMNNQLVYHGAVDGKLGGGYYSIEPKDEKSNPWGLNASSVTFDTALAITVDDFLVGTKQSLAGCVNTFCGLVSLELLDTLTAKMWGTQRQTDPGKTAKPQKFTSEPLKILFQHLIGVWAGKIRLDHDETVRHQKLLKHFLQISQIFTSETPLGLLGGMSFEYATALLGIDQKFEALKNAFNEKEEKSIRILLDGVVARIPEIRDMYGKNVTKLTFLRNFIAMVRSGDSDAEIKTKTKISDLDRYILTRAPHVQEEILKAKADGRTAAHAKLMAIRAAAEEERRIADLPERHKFSVLANHVASFCWQQPEFQKILLVFISHANAHQAFDKLSEDIEKEFEDSMKTVGDEAQALDLISERLLLKRARNLPSHLLRAFQLTLGGHLNVSEADEDMKNIFQLPQTQGFVTEMTRLAQPRMSQIITDSLTRNTYVELGGPKEVRPFCEFGNMLAIQLIKYSEGISHFQLKKDHWLPLDLKFSICCENLAHSRQGGAPLVNPTLASDLILRFFRDICDLTRKVYYPGGFNFGYLPLQDKKLVGEFIARVEKIIASEPLFQSPRLSYCLATDLLYLFCNYARNPQAHSWKEFVASSKLEYESLIVEDPANFEVLSQESTGPEPMHPFASHVQLLVRKQVTAMHTSPAEATGTAHNTGEKRAAETETGAERPPKKATHQADGELLINACISTVKETIQRNFKNHPHLPAVKTSIDKFFSRPEVQDRLIKAAPENFQPNPKWNTLVVMGHCSELMDMDQRLIELSERYQCPDAVAPELAKCNFVYQHFPNPEDKIPEYFTLDKIMYRLRSHNLKDPPATDASITAGQPPAPTDPANPPV